MERGDGARTAWEIMEDDARAAGVVAESHHVWERTCKQVENDWLAGTPCRMVTQECKSESRERKYQNALVVVKTEFRWNSAFRPARAYRRIVARCSVLKRFHPSKKVSTRIRTPIRVKLKFTTASQFGIASGSKPRSKRSSRACCSAFPLPSVFRFSRIRRTLSRRE